MKEDFVPFEFAVKLKEKGFDESCYHKYDDEGYLSFNHAGYINSEKHYDDFCALAPTISQVLKWLREEKKLSVEAFYGTVITGNKFLDDAIRPCWRCCIVPTGEHFYGIRTDLFSSTSVFESYEQSVLAGIEYVLNYLI